MVRCTKGGFKVKTTLKVKLKPELRRKREGKVVSGRGASKYHNTNHRSPPYPKFNLYNDTEVSVWEPEKEGQHVDKDREKDRGRDRERPLSFQ